MSIKNAIRTSLMVTVVVAASACAHGGPKGPAVTWGTVDGPMCSVRVENAYGAPVEAGASAGSREIALGVVERDDAREFEVPCAYRAVTVFRVVRAGQSSEARLGQHVQALSADRVTVLILAPSPARSVHRSSGV